MCGIVNEKEKNKHQKPDEGNDKKSSIEINKETLCTLDNNLASLTALTVSSGCKSPTGISLRHFLQNMLVVEAKAEEVRF